MDQEKAFRNKVTVVSFLCSVLVVFLHSYAYLDVTYNIFAYHVQHFISRNLAQAAVPFFFALSGFLFYKNFDISQLKRKWISRFQSLVIPYLIWNTVYTLFTCAISPLPFINEPPFTLNAHTLYRGILLHAYNGPYWYVRQLIYLTLLCPVLDLLLKKRPVATVFLVVMVALFCFDIRLIGQLQIRAVVYYFLGAYFARHFPQVVMQPRKVSIWGILAFILAEIMIHSSAAEAAPVYIFTRLLLIVAVWELSNLVANIRLPAVLDCCFPIFTMHTIPVETFNKLFSFVLSPANNWILLDYFISPFLTIALIVAVNYLLLQYFPRLHSILFGGRAKVAVKTKAP